MLYPRGRSRHRGPGRPDATDLSLHIEQPAVPALVDAINGQDLEAEGDRIARQTAYWTDLFDAPSRRAERVVKTARGS